MAKSKFLKLQDKNGDKLLDACGEQPVVPELKKCPDCIPNSSAIVPNWKRRGNDEPWKNEKECLYQVTITTPEKSTADPTDPANDAAANLFMKNLFAEFKDTAIESLLVNFDKKQTEEAETTLDAIIEYTKFDLGVRDNARVKLLYSVPADDFDALEDEDGTEEEEDDDDSGADITVTFKAGTMALKMIKIRKALRLYNRYYKVSQFLDKTTFVKKDSGAAFSLDDYGDAGLWGDSKTSKILPELDLFLNKKGLDIPKSSSGQIGSSWWKKDIEKLRITFDSKYKIKKIEAFIAGCDEPKVFKGKKVRALKNKEGFKDSTAMAYFAQMDAMEQALTSRVPMPWVDFLINFTYPAIEEKVDYRSEQEGDPNALTCVADALKSEGKQLGLDILSETFGIGDAIALQFHENVCKESPEDEEEQREWMGLKHAWSEEERARRGAARVKRRKERGERQDARGKARAHRKTEEGRAEHLQQKEGRRQDRKDAGAARRAMAKTQAFADIDPSSFSFEKICADFITGGGVGNTTVDDLFDGVFNNMKLCGFQSLLHEVITCLMGGLTLEEAMSKITKAALSEMSLENFGILFIGLPPAQQKRIEDLAKQKLNSGDIFKDSGQKQKLSDQMAGTSPVVEPWNDPEALEASEQSQESQPAERTIAQQFDLDTAKQRLNSKVIFEAYIQALIEEYSDNLLDLVDKLNEFPGAPLIASLIATMNCPTGPVFDPSVMDWIKDIELPFCRNKDDINIRLINPFGWYPGKADVSAALFEAVKSSIKAAIIEIMIKILQKTCQIFGDAICKRLGVMGDLAVGKLTSDNTFADIVKDSICGDNADDEAVQKATEDIVRSLGPGGAAFANEEDAMNWTNDVSTSTTQDEMTNAFLGDCSDEFLTIVDTIIEYEYPQYRDGLPDKQSICRFFTNVGNLMPADFRNQMKNNLDQAENERQLTPANPSLCITPEQQEQFCELRAQLLEGRASPEQIREMCDNIQDEIGDDLETTAGMAQGDPFQVGPVVSDPGCDNGLIPFESDEAIKSVSTSIADALERLKIDYTEDMLGNGGFGPFKADDDWGMINLILSDTEGNPLTLHNKRAARAFGPTMDYITHEPISFLDAAGGLLGFVSPLALLLATIKPMPTFMQTAALPSKIADWLRNSLATNIWTGPDRISSLWGTFESTNDWEIYAPDSHTFEDLEFTSFFGIGPTDVDLTQIEDKGYNTQFKPMFEELNYDEDGNESPQGTPGDNTVRVIRRGRKGTPDVTLKFRDNHAGRKKYGDKTTYNYGFNIKLFLSDLEEQKGEQRKRNVPNNNSRIIINDATNINAIPEIPNYLASAASFAVNPLLGALKATKALVGSIKNIVEKASDDKELEEMVFEFFAVDDTLDGIRLEPNKYSEFPKLLTAFQSYNEKYPPQLFLLQELIEKGDPNIATNMTDLKTQYDSINTTLLTEIRQLIASNESAFKFGSSFDGLTTEDFDYVEPYEEGVEMTEYDYDWWPPQQDRRLGISRDEWLNEKNGTPENTRVFYLNPMTHGGRRDSFRSPPVYVKALETDGWLGFINAIFPDFSTCPDAQTDFVDFGVIEDRVDESYPRIAEDQRLKDGPDCVQELPYNRILDRAAKAGIEAVISATLQIFISTHLIKSMPVFTLFKPSFSDNYSKIYTSYLVEMLEIALKDAQGAFREAFNTFKDEEFWYAFLEQSVQLYGRIVDDGQIVEVPAGIQAAITRLNDMQTVYKYPSKEDLRIAISIGEEPWHQIFNLPGYRSEKNLEAVQATEEDAKLILGELIAREIDLMAERYAENLKAIGNEPRYSKLAYWFLPELVDGAESLKLKGTLKDSIEDTDLETRTEPFYTNGGELYVEGALDPESMFSDGDDYVGYYHTYTDENGEKVFMSGKEHISVPHDKLGIYVSKIKVKDSLSGTDGSGELIGDIVDFGDAGTSKDFAIEKYISIDGEKMSTSAAKAKIQLRDPHSNLSEHWPGNLKVLEETGRYREVRAEEIAAATGQPVGLIGKLGVRHGLQFYYIISGEKIPLTSIEVDALDTSIKDFATAEPSSKLLLCLIDKLTTDLRFRMITEYIFPLNKYTATSAIYVDLALLPSIGESIYEAAVTRADLASAAATGKESDISIAGADENDWFSTTGKPGMHFDTDALIKQAETDEGLTDINLDDYYGANDGWESYASRRPKGFGALIGIVEWDGWDKELLRKSRNRIKQIFKTYYFSRDFKPGDRLTDERPSKTTVRTLKSFYLPQAGANVLPGWKRNKLRPNPFGKIGKPCKKSDE